MPGSDGIADLETYRPKRCESSSGQPETGMKHVEQCRAAVCRRAEDTQHASPAAGYTAPWLANVPKARGKSAQFPTRARYLDAFWFITFVPKARGKSAQFSTRARYLDAFWFIAFVPKARDKSAQGQGGVAAATLGRQAQDPSVFLISFQEP